MDPSLAPARPQAPQATDAHAEGSHRAGTRLQQRRARAVTYGAVALLLAVAALELEAWPLTSYRLFSSVRTGEGTSSALVAVGHDGTRTPVVMPPGKAVLVTTAHLHDELVRARPERQRQMVTSWLEIAGIDPAGVASVRLEHVRWRMDRESLERTELERTLAAEVAL